MSSINQLSHKELEQKYNGTERNHVVLATVLIVSALVMSELGHAEEISNISNHTSSKSSEKFSSEEYPELIRFLWPDSLENMSAEEIKDSLFQEVESEINFTKNFKKTLNQEIFYREKTGKEPSYVLPIGIKQTEKEIQFLENLKNTLKGMKINKNSLWLLKQLIKNDDVFLENKNWEEWKDLLIIEREESNYTYQIFYEWILKKEEKIK